MRNERKMIDLIASYEEVYKVPFEERVTEYFGDYGMHVLKYRAEISEELEIKALKTIALSKHEFLNNSDFIYRSKIVKRMKTIKSCLDGMRSKDYTLVDEVSDNAPPIVFIHMYNATEIRFDTWNAVERFLAKSDILDCRVCEDRDCKLNVDGLCHSIKTLLDNAASGMYTCSEALIEFNRNEKENPAYAYV